MELQFYIISAAHCVAHFGSHDVAKLEVVFGLHRMQDSNAVRRKVRRVTRHKAYDAKTMV